MELVRVLGIDPSLRNTGLALLEYNNELSLKDAAAFKVSHCQTIVNPSKFTGTDGILNMIDMLSLEAKKLCYQSAEIVIIESPPIMFNKAWGAGTISLIAHIAGAATALFDHEKARLYQPIQWNKKRKKEVTHAETVSFLGDPNGWHYEKKMKKEKQFEHVLDAVSMALWFIKSNYIDE